MFDVFTKFSVVHIILVHVVTGRPMSAACPVNSSHRFFILSHRFFCDELIVRFQYFAMNWLCLFYYGMWCSYTWDSLACSWFLNDIRWQHRMVVLKAIRIRPDATRNRPDVVWTASSRRHLDGMSCPYTVHMAIGIQTLSGWHVQNGGYRLDAVQLQ